MSNFNSASLPENFRQQLLGVDVGERIRLIRQFRGMKTQAQLLLALKEQTGEAPSKGWLSGIESGQLQLTAEKREQLVTILELTSTDSGLLETDADGVEASALLIRYAAWQSVRLAVGKELLRNEKDTQAKLRIRKVLNLLQDTLEANDEILRASGRSLGRLDRLGDLPEVTRVMLLIEAAYMVPFHPLQPSKGKWGDSRKEVLLQIADELGLSDYEAAIDSIDNGRRPGVIRREVMGEEGPKGHDRDPVGLSSAILSVGDPDGTLALIRGGNLVGALGWEFACGTFLAHQTAIDGDEGLDSEGPFSSAGSRAWRVGVASAVPTALMTASLLSPVISPLVFGTAAYIAARRGMTKASRSAMAVDQSNLVDDAPISFLLALGNDTVVHECAKLAALYSVFEILKTPMDQIASVGLLESDVAGSRLVALANSVETYRIERETMDQPGTRNIDELFRVAKTLRTYGGQIAPNGPGKGTKK